MRTVLHSDLNNFYASVECLRNPSLASKPLIVCGDIQSRHGIVLAKNRIAKAMGVKTGDVIWQAKEKCPDLVEVKADFKTYLAYSEKIKAIYRDFTDRVEPFGIDECWLDVSGCEKLFGDGHDIAEAIRGRIRSETGLAVSVGISFNKVFAKLASDLSEPDGTFEISPSNFREKIWSLPVEKLLYVGRATQKKLNRWGIRTIGELAERDLAFLDGMLGKWGVYLHAFANGLDDSPVLKIDSAYPVKSIGNSLTNYRDVTDLRDVTALVSLLCDSVASRLRETNLGRATVLHFHARDCALQSYSKQSKLAYPSRASSDFIKVALRLWREIVPFSTPLRSIGISISGFTGLPEQLSLEGVNGEKEENTEIAVDKLRKKYGGGIVKRAVIQTDERLSSADIKDDHVIHPEAFFRK